MIDDWDDDFIPSELQDNIVCLDQFDQHQREGYTVNLHQGNYENDFQAAQAGARPNPVDAEPLISGSVSIDINGERQNTDIRTLDTLLNVMSRGSSDFLDVGSTNLKHRRPFHQEKIPLLAYTLRGRTGLVSHWTDPCYFTAAFPTLFPTGTGGHLDDRPIPLSLAAFAAWSLRHHSRRQVRFRRPGFH
jgi:hypothetical protein